MKIVQLDRGECGYPITVGELKNATKDLERLISDKERDALIDFIAHNPEAGAIIPNTGGVRKIRWNMSGKGKAKGMRVIYFFHDLNMPLFVLAVYSKGEILRLTKREENQMKQIVIALKKEYRAKWEETIFATNGASCA